MKRVVQNIVWESYIQVITRLVSNVTIYTAPRR